ncbi:VOC family protein [Zhihengliuella alba]|uniref:VOC family protein n=1 Tax=Zhihengliuella alba TaxID=547018 RepID=A0ABP7DQ57_9MICC
MAANGTPTWVDVSLPDVDASKDFYSSLFGWTFEDQGEDYGHYYMVQTADGHVLGGAMAAAPDDPTPPAWTVYLATDDLTGTLERAKEAGGTVLLDAMPTGELGTMAVVAAPSGAVFGLWEARTFEGFDAVDASGHPVWFETMSGDYDADLKFYTRTLGWEPAAMDGVRYSTNRAGDAATAGICDADEFLPPGTPSYWRVYFRVDNTDDAVARLLELGGRVLDGPQDSPFGRLATVADPNGVSFQVIMPPEA